MTIDEAIANYQGISNYLKRYHAPDEEVQLQITNAKCAKWFTEVAEWLTELKKAKSIIRVCNRVLGYLLEHEIESTSTRHEVETLLKNITEYLSGVSKNDT